MFLSSWYFFYIINHLDLFISMTVDNRNQDDEDGYSSQKMPNPNSKCDFKENDALSIQISPLEKVINSKYKMNINLDKYNCN